MSNKAFIVNKTQEGKFVSGIQEIEILTIDKNIIL